jgi:hypothetical protein
MSKTKLTLCLVTLALANALMMIDIMKFGNGDFRGGIFMAILTIAIVTLIYNGVNWLKWIGGPGFTLLAVSAVLAALENDEPSFFVIAVCFVVTAWMVFNVKTTPRSVPSKPQVAPLEEDLLIPEAEVAKEEPAHYPSCLKG